MILPAVNNVLLLLQLTNFGFTVLPDIDPNHDNFVAASIVKTSNVLVGCLLRLEPNYQTKVDH